MSEIFTGIEKVILRVTYSTRRFMSKNEIVKKSNIYWMLLDKPLKSLIKKNWLVVDKEGSKIRYRFNIEKLIKMRESKEARKVRKVLG